MENKTTCNCPDCAVKLETLSDMGPAVHETTFRLNGLDCADCAQKLEKRLQKHPGVVSATVSFAASSAKVAYDCPRQEITGIIRASGYTVSDSDLKSTTFEVGGLDCADCARTFEKAMRSAPGVVSADVNFSAARMIVEHTGSVNDLVKAASGIGYRIRPAGEGQEKRESILSKRKFEISTALSAVFVAAGFGAGLMGLPSDAQVILFVIAVITGGFFIARKALYALRTLTPDMNLLMTMAAVGAMAIGQWEEAATITFLFAFGNALQSFTLDRTRNSIRDLIKISPKDAMIVRDGIETRVDVGQIRTGDTMIVRPGEKIAMDGTVIKGTSFVNQAPITGESMPVEKNEGSEVYAGTINERGALEVRVTRLARDNTLSKIIQMVEEAQANRAPSQELVDRFAKYYTPVVIILAAGIAIVPALFGQPFDTWFYRALVLLVIACPCALVISTPVSIVAAIGNSSRNGVLIKGGAYLEEIGKARAVAFDKTGTLTAGRPAVTEVIAFDSLPRNEVIRIAATLESRSEHPLAEAIVKANNGSPALMMTGFESVTGMGVRGTVAGKAYRLGNGKMFDNGMITPGVKAAVERLQENATTPVILGDDKEVLAVIGIADEMRAASKDIVGLLHRAGVEKVVMLTGDNDKTAKAIADRISLDGYYADLLPQDKAARIDAIRREYGNVVMVGDGINDAPALARANVGIAMGATGSDTALETADVALMSDDLTRIEYVMRLGKRTIGIIKQNIAFSIIIKLIFVTLAVFGVATLWMAVFADTGASILVTLNGMRLLRTRK